MKDKKFILTIKITSDGRNSKEDLLEYLDTQVNRGDGYYFQVDEALIMEHKKP